MAKASQPGRTKTRLVPPLSFEDAARLNTSFLRDAIANIRLAAQTASVSAGIAYAPAGTEAFFLDQLPGVTLVEAASSDFGDNLCRAASGFLSKGYQGVCLLNADTPDLPTGFLVQATLLLQAPGDRIVLGPATDGGYYLLGLKQPHPKLFEAIAWSTDQVFAQTCGRAAELSLDVLFLPEWEDVDDWGSLRRLSARLNTSRCGPRPYCAQQTVAVLAALLSQIGGQQHA